ncbi:phosphodiester glycosidase family protein [Sphingosinithalassobacter sp. CS137]|uniref:phosphodiester glycosidase family protein n=1 Tax=Sphingosinithalassobacter sp. CS137 TaxID=2762748 RepID=UPI00165DC988|nr:phosphodiester glycosidase family protein [Sphingosinithalassobacter sp. CS137]
MLSLRILAFLAVLALAACGGPGPQSAERLEPPCREVAFEGNHFTVCRTQPGRHDLRLASLDSAGAPLRDFDRLETHLGADRTRVAFAMNAGMYDARGRPIGLYVERGREAKALNRNPGPGNFHMLPNGVFWGNPDGWHVTPTSEFAERGPEDLSFATQSGPMLVIDGALHPDFAPNGRSLRIRNGVGVDAKGNAWFAISGEPVSFGRFARLFRDRLDCPNALYLDGAVSRLWYPEGRRRDPGVPLGPIVVALQSR